MSSAASPACRRPVCTNSYGAALTLFVGRKLPFWHRKADRQQPWRHSLRSVITGLPRTICIPLLINVVLYDTPRCSVWDITQLRKALLWNL